MGHVEAFALEGLKLWFNSSDHLPPHLHVKRRGDWEIRVFFLECTENNLACDRKWGRKSPSATDRAAILKPVLEHRVALLEKLGTESMQVELNSPAPNITVLVHGTGSEDLLPKEKGLHVVRHPRLQIAERAINVFVLVPATDLPDVSEFVSVANRRHQLRALFVRDDTNARWLPHWFERAGLRTLRNTLVHSDASVPRRVLTAWLHGAQNELIADASVADDQLFVISCALDRYEVPFDEVPAMKSIPKAQRNTFEVDEDGSYIYWPGPDIHVDLDAIRAAINPEWRAKVEVAKATRTQRYGAAIAKLRAAKGLKQADIEGLSDRHVRRIEKGEGTTSEALRRLAEAHGMSLDKYLREVATVLARSESEAAARAKASVA